MKKDEIINNIKTAGVVAGLALSMNTCGDKPLTQEQRNTLSIKADSACNTNRDYIVARGMAEFSTYKISKYREVNKKIVKEYANYYIRREIKDMNLRNFMMSLMEKENIPDIYEPLDENDDLNGVETDNINMTYIRNNQRWFNDLMLYLTNKYDDRQLLNSEFFKVINNPRLRQVFENNTKNIEELKIVEKIADQKKCAIYNESLKKYENEVKHSKQR